MSAADKNSRSTIPRLVNSRASLPPRIPRLRPPCQVLAALVLAVPRERWDQCLDAFVAEVEHLGCRARRKGDRYAIIFDSIWEVRMGQVLVRNLDDRVIESLKTKAELKGRSLEQELRDVLTNAAPLTPEEKIALFQKLRAMTPPVGDVDVRAAIRRGRDDEFDE